MTNDLGYPSDQRVEELILGHARTQPQKRAVLGPDSSLTYQELARLSRAYAEALALHGVRPRDFVGVCVTQRPEQIALLLAILRLGAAYVPVDSRYPRDRITAVAEDAGLKLIVASAENQALVSDLPVSNARAAPQIASFESLPQAPTGDPLATFDQDGCTLDDIHYVRFTSGSTGRPKGVVQPQRGAIRLAWNTTGFDIVPDDVFLRFANLSFDLSVLDIWCSLMRGASVAMAASGPLSLSALGRAIEQFGVTCLVVSTGVFHQCVETGVPQFARLRWIQAAGDTLSRDHARRFLETFPQVRLVNAYGPTENGVYVSAAGFLGVDSLDEGPVTIGAPVLDTLVRIVDSAGRELGVGQEGELLCGGGGISRGYASRPDLTAERYLELPGVNGRPERFYRTGDLTRWRADGRIDFLGRMDRQVKIRGFRIELAEVENALRRHPDVCDAYALAEAMPNGNKRLVAYAAVGESGRRGDELVQFLAQSLPEYMLPACLITAPVFPLNFNGKVDLKAMPKPHDLEPRAAAARQPLDPVETRLLEIWKTALHLEHLDPDAPFVALGGDSLVAVALLARVEREFGRQLAPADVLQCDTVRKMAVLLRDEAAASAGVLSIRTGSGAPLFFLPGLHGDLFTIRALALRLRHACPIFGLQPPGADGRSQPLPSLEALRDFYLEQIRSIQPAGPYRLLGHSIGGTLAFEVSRALLRQNEAVELLLLVDAPRLAQPRLQRRLRRWYQQLLAPLRPKLRLALADQPHPLIMPLVETTLAAFERYRAQPLDLRAHQIIPTEKPNERRLIDDPRGMFSWRGYVAAGSPVTQLSGDHNTLWKEPYVAALADLVDAELAACDAQPRAQRPEACAV